MPKIANPHGASPVSLLQLRVELAWLKPAIWRRLVVPGTITLAKLHQALQAAMGWTNSHLHGFEISGQHYGVPHPDWDFGGRTVNSQKRANLADSLAGAKSLRYTYDFGDGWEHQIRIEKVLAPDAHPRTPICIAGANACPPEDVGGPPGYIEFLNAISDPNHPEHADMLAWAPPNFDPTAFDIAAINKRLLRIKP